MSERLPTQKTIEKSSERTSEEVKLRGLIQALEERAKHAHGTQADDLESKILANEESLHAVEKPSTNKVPTPSAQERQETVEDTPSSRKTTLIESSSKEAPEEIHPLSQESPASPAAQAEATPKASKDILKAPEILEITKAAPETSLGSRAEVFAERAQVGEARAKMIAAEAAYLGAFRQQHKDQGVLARLAGKNSPEKVQRERTQELREAYDEARAEFASAVNTSAQKRFDTKHSTENVSDVKLRTEEAHKEKVLRRYNRMVVSSDVIKRSLQEKARAKKEGLDESERLSLGKALGWYTRGNQALEKKVGKVGARGIRILTFATIGGAAGGFLSVGHRVIRSGLGALFGTAAGAFAGKKYEEKWGKTSAAEHQKKSEESISSVADIAAQEKSYKKGSAQAIANKRHLVEAITAMLVGAGTSIEAAHFFASSHAVHTAAEHLSNVQENSQLPPAVVEAAHQTDVNAWHDLHPGEPYPGDAAARHAIDEYEFGHSSAEHLSPSSHPFISDSAVHAGGLVNHGGILGSSAAAEHLSNVQENSQLPPAVVEAAHQTDVNAWHDLHPGEPYPGDAAARHAIDEYEFGHSSAEHLSHAQAPHEIISVAEGKGEGADALFGHLKESLQAAYPDPSTAPPEVQHILDTRLHELSSEYGFAKSGESGLMSMHDTLSFNPSDGHLVFTDTHGAHILESTSDGELVKGATFNQFDDHYTHNAVPGAPVGEVEAPVPTPEAVVPVVPLVTEHTVNGLTHHEGVLSAAPDAHVVHDSSGGVVHDSEGNPVHSGTYGEPPAPEAVSHSVGEATPLPTPESAASFHHEVTGLLQNDALGNYAHTSVSDVLYQSPDISTQLHEQLVETVAHSGVGPTNNESLEHFLHRANTLITERGTPTYEVGEHGLSIPVDQTQIYTDTHGDLVVYGGDPSAQHLVAYQYLEKHPDARILFERGGHDEASGVNALTLHASPLPSAESQPFQSFTPLRDSSGKVIESINPRTLSAVVH